ncbi:MAG: OmpA family protein [Bacteroidetes bacterium]|nr:OmpA family protein [Bacteroidota bacterium]
MKKVFLLFVLLTLAGSLFAQSYEKAWGVGATFNSVRFTSDVIADKLNFGFNGYAQYDLSTRHALRAVVGYDVLTGQDPTNLATEITTNSLSLGLDYLFKFNYDIPIYPYFGAGFSIVAFGVDNGLREGSTFDELSANLFFGAMFDIIGERLKLKGEFSQHTLSTDYFDGINGLTGGLFGGSMDSYFAFGIGIHYYIDGEVVKESVLPSGITEVDYERIDNINKKYAAEKVEPKINSLQDEVNGLSAQVDELMKELKKKQDAKPVPAYFDNVYFSVNSATPTFDSMEDLLHTAKVLSGNKSLKVEIVGNTDNTGSDKYNYDLSKKRADFVQNFLVSKGVDAANVSVKSEGAKSPLTDNATADGKALNRRVEINVVK